MTSKHHNNRAASLLDAVYHHLLATIKREEAAEATLVDVALALAAFTAAADLALDCGVETDELRDSAEVAVLTGSPPPDAPAPPSAGGCLHQSSPDYRRALRIEDYDSADAYLAGRELVLTPPLTPPPAAWAVE